MDDSMSQSLETPLTASRPYNIPLTGQILTVMKIHVNFNANNIYHMIYLI
jgi:hypothetical protein